MTIKELVASLEGEVLEGASWDTVVMIRGTDGVFEPVDQVVTTTIAFEERVVLV